MKINNNHNLLIINTLHINALLCLYKIYCNIQFNIMYQFSQNEKIASFVHL